MDQHQYVILNGIETPVLSRWSFNPADPYAVTLAFRGEQGHWIAWTFARELIVEGLHHPVGLGDVRVRPDLSGASLMVIELESPDGYAVVEIEREDVKSFVAATIEVVPLGSEIVDVDAFIAEIIKV